MPVQLVIYLPVVERHGTGRGELGLNGVKPGADQNALKRNNRIAIQDFPIEVRTKPIDAGADGHSGIVVCTSVQHARNVQDTSLTMPAFDRRDGSVQETRAGRNAPRFAACANNHMFRIGFAIFRRRW